MAQRTSSLYRIVGVPAFYKAFQSALGADAANRRFVDEVLKPAPGMRVLDCGCGPASLFSYLSGVDYTGIDLNPKHIADARENYGEAGHFIVGDATRDLASHASTFDLVLISALLHHLGDDGARRLLAATSSMVKLGGRIVTLDAVWLPSQNPLAWLLNKLDSGLNVRTPVGYTNLAAGLPLMVQTQTYRDMLRIPYDHFVMTLTRVE